MLRKTSAILFALATISTGVLASPARRGSFLVFQPDGTSFMATLKGDEYGHILTTSDGCAVVRNADGFYEYAYFNSDGSKEPTGYKAGTKAPVLVLNESRNIPYMTLLSSARTARPRVTEGMGVLRPMTRSGPVRKNCIVLPVQFKDVKFQSEDRRSDFDNLINNGPNSALAYFNDQFRGQYEFNFTIGPVVTVSRDISYYGKDLADRPGQDSNAQELVEEACRLADPFVDFSLFDDDNDGYVDNVFLFVAGKDQAEGAGEDFIWPHQWSVFNYLVLDGVRIYDYAMSTELAVTSQKSNGQLVWGLASIGTFCHEYSHVLGLFDFYDTDGEGSGGIANGLWGTTGIMDSGCYNNGGKTPPAYSAADLELLGIGERELMKTGTYVLEPVTENRRYLVLENPNDSLEFFLFECREQTGWDKYIGGSGLAIYHIDFSKDHNAGYSDREERELTAWERWYYGQVNCNPYFECADMIETSANALDVSQAFFPYRNVTSFTINSNPAFRFNDGTFSPYSIAGITQSGNRVTFVVYKSDEMVPNAMNVTSQVFQDAVIVNWESNLQDFSGDATITCGETSGASVTCTVSPYEPGKYSFTMEGLSPTKAYSMTLNFIRNGIAGDKFTYDFMTKARQSGKKPYIYLEHLSSQRVRGKFPAGAGLPLRVFNAIGEKVSWYYNGVGIIPDGSGFFHPEESGTLKAVITHSGGGKEIIIKEITIQK